MHWVRICILGELISDSDTGCISHPRRMTSLQMVGGGVAAARALVGSRCNGYSWVAEARANKRSADFMAPQFNACPVGVNLSEWITTELNGSQWCGRYCCFDVSLTMQTAQDQRRAAGCPSQCTYPQGRTNRGAQGAKRCGDGQAVQLLG